MPQMCPNCSRDNPDNAHTCAHCHEPLLGLLGHNTMLEGRYRVTRVLGCGGMGAVYLAQDMRLSNKLVAVKEMIPDPNVSPAEQAQAQQQFQLEASMLASLDHPNLPRVSDYFTERGKHYLVMDYVDGETLEDILSRTPGFLPESQVLDWATQLCDVLSYLHSRQPPVIFRDLKPCNIMVNRSGTVKLIDFGIARLFKPGKHTDTLRMGTMGYAPPEQYAGHGQTDARSDIYSLGATLHHLLTKRDPTQHPPFTFDTAPPRSLNLAVSPHVEAAIMRAVAYDRSHRFQSASEMKQALLGGTPPGPPFTGTTVVVTPPAGKRRLVQRAMTLLLITLIALLAGIVLPTVWRSVTSALPTPTVARVVALATGTATPRTEPSVLPSVTDTMRPIEAPTPTLALPTATSEVVMLPTPSPTSVLPPTRPLPTGKIAFHSARDGNNEIYIMNADGSHQTRLTNHPASDHFPASSPDGRRIAFVSERDGNPEIYVMNVDGTDQTRLTFDPAEDRLPAWSPDGTRIAFNSEREGNLDLYVMNADGSNPVRLTNNSARDGHATWSPDGYWIAFNSGPTQDEWEIYLIPAPGGNWLRLTENSVIDWSPSWSPDGRYILFLSKRPDNADIYIMETNGSSQKKIFGGPGYDWGAVWSPDGQFIAFSSDQNGEDDIYIMRADGGDVRRLTYEGGAYPSWSR